MNHMRRWAWSSVALAALILLGTLAAASSAPGRQLRHEIEQRSPQEIIRYLKRRLQGHDKLEWLTLPGLHAWQRRVEREPPAGPLPRLGKGQSPHPLDTTAKPPLETLRVTTASEAIEALLKAPPGSLIVLAPGRYAFDKELRLGHDGRATAPIVVKALIPGSVRLEFRQVEGILVDRPHWTFENLDIRGACKRHHDCEHAFHVVGRGSSTVLRNNIIQDFNAHIKINGASGEWPDHGLVAFNTLTNTAPRQTDRPVVAIDLVGANHWRVLDNVISDLVKTSGNQVSYGLFMKGASEGGRIERNLVVCTSTNISAPGVRVGISFGGGGTDPGACRTDQCQQYEHRNGLAANNIVAHCNDVGMDVNRSNRIVLAYNTLINTAGFVVRRPPSDARLIANLYEGRTLARDGARLSEEMHTRMNASETFVHPDGLQMENLKPPELIPSWRFVTNDFSGQTRGHLTMAGAIASPRP